MSALDDVSKLSESAADHNVPRETLLAKYRIPIQHFEFDYVKSCSDGRELEKILSVLRSGEEGFYPDLTEATEKRLSQINPKSKLLRKAVRVADKKSLEKEELEDINNDLNSFLAGISRADRELLGRKTNTVNCESEVRGFKKLTEPKDEKKKEERIKSSDYTGWDKYDPDTELLKMELEEQKANKPFLEQPKIKPKKSVSFNSFATEAEALFVSDREREQGNESFKAGEFEEALYHYTNSIRSKCNVDNLNNRAATYLKLKKYEESISDCKSVFSLEPENLKAHIRMAQALENLSRFEEALENIEFVICRDPNNGLAQEIAERIRRHFDSCAGVKNTRLKIVEIE